MNVLVVGLGEVGKPILRILARVYSCQGKDVEPGEVRWPIAVMHVAYPYEIEDFVATTVRYITEYQPELTIIHSTVVPGTTRRIAQESGSAVVYSPLRGKHARMQEDLLAYTKYVAGLTQTSTAAAADHLSRAGMQTKPFSTPEALEIAKLLETTYFGLLVAWAQEMERYCRAYDADYDEVMRFTQEIDYLPPVVFQPGFIGGHCVIPNAHLLDQVRPSRFTKVLRASNELKRQEWLREGRSLEEKLSPKKRDDGQQSHLGPRAAAVDVPNPQPKGN